MKVEHPIEVGNVDVVFHVRRGVELLGTLKLSKGGLHWYPENAHKPRTTNWEQLDTWMRTE